MKLKLILTSSLLLGVLVGCGDDDVDQDELVTNPEPTNEMTTENEEQTNGQSEGNQQEDTAYNFTHFDLDVEYANDVSYNAEYTSNQNGIAAEFEDEVNRIDTSGDEAYNHFAQYLEQLTFDENTEDQEVLNQVMTAFGLDENYTEFELEVKFENGDTKTYRFTK
ncbi:YusW family protein [Lysinibacillus sp. SGAir0095]|uniref:YusW family protein n=1 Tax=Lysinibacillus sp. SGAir0095 TaxID=2070463 RepID=UPI0010CD3D93|nr:YusW family protein [Lysinibacillus sp. SGAir0095]QCR33933.1 hypothetical protein C1N55_18145 [Lysinibacillus sp. SGAir0095]